MKGIWKFLIFLVIGLVLALGVAFNRGLAGAEDTAGALIALCDGFFVAGALLFGIGALQWTYNGGVMDGLTFTFKTAVARIRKHYEEDKKSFADYRAEREEKSVSPKWMLLAGLAHLAAAAALLMAYMNV